MLKDLVYLTKNKNLFHEYMIIETNFILNTLILKLLMVLVIIHLYMKINLELKTDF